jgi:hypothetical protein
MHQELTTVAQPISVRPLPEVRIQSFVAPIASLRRHPKLAASVCVALAALSTLAIKARVKPTYTTEAIVYVSPTFIRNLSQDHEQDTQFYQYNTFIQHQVKSVARYDILAAALKNVGAKAGEWQKPGQSERDSVERLQSSLSVERIPDTYQLRIALTGGSPSGQGTSAAGRFIRREIAASHCLDSGARFRNSAHRRSQSFR